MPTLRIPAPASAFAPCGDAPRLSVVGGREAELRPVETVVDFPWGTLTVRSWTEAQWALMRDDERPPGAGRHRDLYVTYHSAPIIPGGGAATSAGPGAGPHRLA